MKQMTRPVCMFCKIPRHLLRDYLCSKAQYGYHYFIESNIQHASGSQTPEEQHRMNRLRQKD